MVSEPSTLLSSCIVGQTYGALMVYNHNFKTHDWLDSHTHLLSLALVFDPDRFLDERVKKYLTPNPFIFCPFNAGPRICLGQQV